MPPGPGPALSVQAGDNSTAFLGTFWPGDEPQLVAVSGASLAGTEFLPSTGALAVALYRAAPGMQVQVAVHPGAWQVKGATVEGGGLDHAAFDRTGQIYVVQATATEERMTVAVELEWQRVYLPLVLKSF